MCGMFLSLLRVCACTRAWVQTAGGKLGKGSNAIALEDDSKFIDDDLSYPTENSKEYDDPCSFECDERLPYT
jgi:hypothetical protein